MKDKKTDFKFKVNLVEYERGWGSKIDQVKEFTTYKLAEKFVKKFNAKNKSETVPDWYMVAERANYKEIKKEA